MKQVGWEGKLRGIRKKSLVFVPLIVLLIIAVLTLNGCSFTTGRLSPLVEVNPQIPQPPVQLLLPLGKPTPLPLLGGNVYPEDIIDVVTENNLLLMEYKFQLEGWQIWWESVMDATLDKQTPKP